jgi:hypothetical protein
MADTARKLDPRAITKDGAKEILTRWNQLFWSSYGSHVYDHQITEAVRGYESDGRLGQWSDAADESVITDWCVLGLDWILGDTGNQVGIPSTVEKTISDWSKRNTTTLTAAVEDAIKEASDEQREEWEDDPEGFRKWHHKDLDKCEHPWSDETVALTHLWLSMHPFEWFTLYRTAEEWGFDVVRENLRAYAFESDDSKDVGETIRKRVCETMSKWAKRVEEGRW